MCREQGIRLLIAHCLTGVAGIAAAQGQAIVALRLAGAAEALRVALGITPTPAWQARYVQVLASAWQSWEASAGTREWQTGQAVPLEDVIDEALRLLALCA